LKKLGTYHDQSADLPQNVLVIASLL